MSRIRTATRAAGRLRPLLALVLACAAAGVARGGESYAVDRHAIAGGGGRSTGGTFTLFGVAGQHEADPLHPATGGTFELVGGLLAAPTDTPRPDALFGDGFEDATPR